MIHGWHYAVTRFSDVEEKDALGFDQYHEPADELPQETRTFARIIVSLIEEAEAIDLVRAGLGRRAR